jgi:hypothetical protein
MYVLISETRCITKPKKIRAAIKQTVIVWIEFTSYFVLTSW